MPRGLIARFRNYFLTGLIVAGPVAITLYLTWWFVNWVDNLVRPFVPMAYRPETYLPFILPGSGLIVAVFALTMLGFLTANLIGRTLVEIGEKVLGRMPVVRAIVRNSAKDNYSLLSIVLGVVDSYPFLMRTNSSSSGINAVAATQSNP